MDSAEKPIRIIDRAEGIKTFLGTELHGNPDVLPYDLSLPSDIYDIAHQLISDNSLQEKLAQIDYEKTSSHFVPRNLFRGGTYRKNKKEVNPTSLWGYFSSMQSRALHGDPFIELHNHPDLVSVGDGYTISGIRLPDAFTKLSLRVPSAADLHVYLSLSQGLMNMIATPYGGSIVVPWYDRVKSRRPLGITNFSESSIDTEIGKRTVPVITEGLRRFGSNAQQLDYFTRTTLQRVAYQAYAEVLKPFECSIYFADDISKIFHRAKPE